MKLRYLRYCCFIVIFNGLFLGSGFLNAAIDMEMPLYHLQHQVMGQSSYARLDSYQNLLNALFLGLVAIKIGTMSMDAGEELPEDTMEGSETEPASRKHVVVYQSESILPASWWVKTVPGGKEGDKAEGPVPTTCQQDSQYGGSPGGNTQPLSGAVGGATGGGGDGDPPEDRPNSEQFSSDFFIIVEKKDDDEDENEKSVTSLLEDGLLYGDVDIEPESEGAGSSLVTMSSAGSPSVSSRILDRLDELKRLRDSRRGELSALRTGLEREMATTTATLRNEIATAETGVRSEMAAAELRLRAEIATVNKRLQTSINYGERIETLESEISAIRDEIKQLESRLLRNSGANTQLIMANIKSIQELKKRLENAEQRAASFELRFQALSNRPQAAGVTAQQFSELQDSIYAMQIQVNELRGAGGQNNAWANGEGGNEVGQLRGQITVLEDEVMRLRQGTNEPRNGQLIWRITEVEKKQEEARSGRVRSMYSPAFWSDAFGYRMCVRLYFNGDGSGKGTHLSLFIVVMKGDYDALLRWPSNLKVTMILIDQNGIKNWDDSFNSDPDSSSFQRPTDDMNIAFGCPMFIPLHELGTRGYIKEDTMFIKITVRNMDY